MKEATLQIASRMQAQKQIAELERQIAELKKIQSVKTPEDLADFLHQKMCLFNHADGCGYHYEIKNNIHNWSANEHADWLKKANRMLKIFNDPEKIATLIEAYLN